ncbi:MAG: phosphoglucomutase [Bacteroidetes bacterium HGW-Bacteroidetes-14]|jgi:phosphoglucomutase|nr:MAG: phosphoglucomutase [Bacteroidetes bacterium HGW-Bacteroidetes-14]
MEKNYSDIARKWLEESYDEETRNEVKRMMEENPAELEDSFYKNLEFGTGGLRGIMGAGTNRMNRYTVGMATQGLSNYIKNCFRGRASLAVAVAYDSRNNSREFAGITASVFASNGFRVYLFDELRPTPVLSFAIRHYKCVAGVMITASHNPKEYNGYKAYWEDGAQITAPHDANIIAEVEKITDISMVKFTGENLDIHLKGQEIDDAYLRAVMSLTLSPEIVKKHNHFKIVYTPIHGTGVKIVPRILKELGFNNIINIPEQDVSDGNFPTVKSPNPEESATLEMALKKAEETSADLVMATDPDADRLGIAVRDREGKLVLLNGNQTAAILSYYLLERWKELGKLKEGSNPSYYMAKTIVTTDLLKSMAESYGVEMIEVLTGFKYIAEVVRMNEGKRTFIGGGEESYGFNAGEFVRDKDAVLACALVAEAAAWAEERGESLYEMLIGIYVKFGFYKEKLLSVTKKGMNGLEQIKSIMRGLREEPLQNLAGSEVVLVHDYKSSESIDMISDLRFKLNFPKSDVLQFVSADNSIVSVRPSGTEPKIKYYFGVKATLNSAEDFDRLNSELDHKLAALAEQLSSL